MTADPRPEWRKHADRAGQLINLSKGSATDASWAQRYLAEAQVEATLAVACATAESGPRPGMR